VNISQPKLRSEKIDNNNNATFKQDGLHQMEDEMDVICSTQRKMNMYGKMQ
jgi:hypothetical protein